MIRAVSSMILIKAKWNLCYQNPQSQVGTSTKEGQGEKTHTQRNFDYKSIIYIYYL